MSIHVLVKRLPHGADLPLPSYATPGAVGMDLMAAIPEPIRLPPGARRLIPTGLSVALPPGFEMQIRPRSGLALKQGLTVLNSPGTIDADYRGEVGVILLNTDPWAEVVVEPGMRIAQAVVAPVARVEWDDADSLDTTERGGAGFGSTGA